MIKKHIFTIVMITALVLCAGGCGKAGSGSQAPAETTAAPAETTAAPVEITAAPAETTAAPAETTAAQTAASGSASESGSSASGLTGKVLDPEEAAAMNEAVEKILKENDLGYQRSEYDEESHVYIYYFDNSKVTTIYLDPKQYDTVVAEFETKMNALCRSVLASWSTAGMDIHTEFIFLNSINTENLLFASFDGYTLYSAK